MCHLLAHALIAIAALQITSPLTPPEAITAASVLLAVVLELAQKMFVKGRTARLDDLAAATIGSFAVFLTPRDGRYLMPNCGVLREWLYADDEDEDEDSHRVQSWAV